MVAAILESNMDGTRSTMKGGNNGHKNVLEFLTVKVLTHWLPFQKVSLWWPTPLL